VSVVQSQRWTRQKSRFSQLIISPPAALVYRMQRV
jgi:hypothetical protein